MTDTRWFVERPKGGFDDVGASSLEFLDGCLIFKDEDGELLLAYGRDHWVTVTAQATS